MGFEGVLLLRHSEAARPKNPYPRPFPFLLGTKTGKTDSSPSLRPRKVRFTLFPPDGENALRSLARPLTTRPTSLGSCCVKDGSYGFFGLRPQNDGGGGVVLLCVGHAQDHAPFLSF